MDFKSLKSKTKDPLDELFDLVIPTFIYRTDIPLRSFDVEQKHEMRIDLIFQDMYGLESNEVGLYLDDIDVILFLNFIDNPLNIKKDMILFYTETLEQLSSFRISEDDFELKNKNIDKIVVPNKSTRIDKNRQLNLSENLTFSPVIKRTPRRSVEIRNGVFNIGGL
jgi:hypothetical protein